MVRRRIVRGEPVLRFDEALRICREGGAVLLIEHKTGDPGAFAAVIRETAMGAKVIVQSFDWDFLFGFRAEWPGIPVGALGDGILEEARAGGWRTSTRLDRLARRGLQGNGSCLRENDRCEARPLDGERS